MKTASRRPIILFVALIFLLSACKANISRNQDGSLDVETSMSQQQLQDAITAAIADPLIKEINVSLQSGYVLVSGTRTRENDASKTDTLTFRLDLGASNGQLTALISNAQLDDKPIDQSRVDHWNETLSNRIALVSQKRPNSTLKSVSVTSSAVTMTWNLKK